MKEKVKSKSPLILSYLELRRAIGYLGALLPLVLWLGAFLMNRTELQDSISSYYYTGMRNVFVGVLCSIGVFMLFYKGYECADAVASRLGGIFAICTALFPTEPDCYPTVNEECIGCFHFTFAGLFFITIAYMSIFLFTKTHPPKSRLPISAYLSLFSPKKASPGNSTKKKLKRNLIYYACGIIILVSLLLIGIYYGFYHKEGVSAGNGNLVFWLEAIAVVAFGISWIIKGETFLKD